MLYPICPTCHNLLADKQLPYEDGMKKINKLNKSNEEKMKLKKKLLDDIGLSRYCCRMRMISYLDQCKLII